MREYLWLFAALFCLIYGGACAAAIVVDRVEKFWLRMFIGAATLALGVWLLQHAP